MLRKLSETFTATHFTILAAIAMLAPSALYATVTTNAVSITDPNLGTKSLVDAARRLYVYDPIAGNQNYPGNYVQVILSCFNGSYANSYTVPSGKALIVKSANFHYYSGTSGSDNYIYLYADGAGVLAALESVNAVDSGSDELGNGYVVRNSMFAGCGTGSYSGVVVGYLVPSSQVPSANAVGQSVRVGPAMMKNGRPM